MNILNNPNKNGEYIYNIKVNETDKWPAIFDLDAQKAIS
jgi:hypothetical protein